MARKKKEQPLVEQVAITGVAAEGNALTRLDDLVVFIPYGAPGDVADLRIVRRKRNYADARIERLITPSPLRRTPACPHFGLCGGCKWQHLDYQAQLDAKRQQVVDALQRIAKVECPEVNPTLGSADTLGYRNKLEFTFSNRRWLTFDEVREGVEAGPGAGFHVAGAFDKVLDLSTCLLQEDYADRVRNFLKKYALDKGYTFYDLRNHGGLIRTLMVRTATTGQKMLVVVFGEDRPKEIADVLEALQREFPETTSLIYAVNTKLNDSTADLDMKVANGEAFIEEQLGEMRYRVGPKSFFQTNSRQAKTLYDTALRMASLTGSETVYDLYTGAGTIACYVARHAARVIGIEYVPEAIEDAWINAEVNGIKNVDFTAGDMKDVLTREFIAEHGAPDVMIVDPPRAGMHPDVVDVILEAEPRRIVYVSCNPATQARDLALLDSKYRIEEVQPVDMFPHTHHVENVVKLNRR